MTAEQLHDALTLLPTDLIAEADKARCPKSKVLRRKPLAALAACFVLILGSGLFLMRLELMGSVTEQAAAEAPAAAAPMPGEPESNEIGKDASPREEVRQESVLTEEAAGSVAENSLCIDHAHIPAESAENTSGAHGHGWCGNMTVTVYLDEVPHALSGSDAVVLTDILYHLEYSPENLCRCAADFSVDTEMGTGYAISLCQHFVRFEGGQAALTEEQAEKIHAIVDRLEDLP